MADAAAAVFALLMALALAGAAAGGDIVHHDDEAPKIPGCSNAFILKVQSWVSGKEDDEYVGVRAWFGPKIVSKEKHTNRTRLTMADPIDFCTAPREKVSGDILLVQRGNVSSQKSKVCRSCRCFWYNNHKPCP